MHTSHEDKTTFTLSIDVRITIDVVIIYIEHHVGSVSFPQVHPI